MCQTVSYNIRSSTAAFRSRKCTPGHQTHIAVPHVLQAHETSKCLSSSLELSPGGIIRAPVRCLAGASPSRARAFDSSAGKGESASSFPYESKVTAYGIPRPVSNMTVCGERLGDDAMGVQGSRARLAAMLAGGVWFRAVHAAVIIPADVDASVVYSAVLVRPL